MARLLPRTIQKDTSIGNSNDLELVFKVVVYPDAPHCIGAQFLSVVHIFVEVEKY